jgi:protein kinase 1
MDPSVQAALTVNPNDIVYDVGSALGQGAFGQVRSATYQGRCVAVKAQEVETGSEDYDYLLKEMKIMLELDHPNVLKLVAAAKQPLGSNQDRYLLLMEICELRDVRKLAEKRAEAGSPLTWFQVTYLLLGAARGVEFLHTNGVLHRDIKTENLLVARGMVCKIGDFGMSRKEAQGRGKMGNKHMTLCGTDEFMAPEVLFEEPYNFQADSFSFGVVIAELLCRTVPGSSTGFLQRAPRTQFNIDFEDLEERMENNDSPVQVRVGGVWVLVVLVVLWSAATA